MKITVSLQDGTEIKVKVAAKKLVFAGIVYTASTSYNTFYGQTDFEGPTIEAAVDGLISKIEHSE